MTTMAARQIDFEEEEDEAQEEEEVEMWMRNLAQEVGFVGVDALTRTYRSSCELRAASCCNPSRVAPASLAHT
jgi:hypothetical protein